MYGIVPIFGIYAGKDTVVDDKLYPLIVLLVGLVVVFVGLICLVFIVKLMALICSLVAGKGKKANAASNTPEKATVANPSMSDEERRRLVTAISAAIGEVTGLDNLIIKSIKRIGSDDSSRAGEERQRKIAAISAAIAETSGMKSDSFKITSVKRV